MNGPQPILHLVAVCIAAFTTGSTEDMNGPREAPTATEYSWLLDFQSDSNTGLDELTVGGPMLGLEMTF